ncbi:MAG: hypothetical protein O7G88_18390 [bacterium]|nr:hypothetical protein [bacterium]
MSTGKNTLIVILGCFLSIFIGGSVHADNAGWEIPSPVLTNAITFDGIEVGSEWAGAHSFTIMDSGDPLQAVVRAFHNGDGIYLLITVNDISFSNNDAVHIHFDIDHSHNLLPDTDWGIEILRNGQARWGPRNTAVPDDPFNSAGPFWVPIPSGVDVNDDGATWTLEVLLPTGSPSGLDLSTGIVGIHIRLYNVDLENGFNTALYTSWPAPVLENLLDSLPDDWANYEFDPAATFPDVSVTNIRNNWPGSVSEDWRKIRHVGDNVFQVFLKNTETAIGDAEDVRVNLYLAAIGIGEPWHRLDIAGVLTADCAAAEWLSQSVPKPTVCDNSNPWPDIVTQSLANVAAGTADYTIQNGTSARGGESITVNSGFDDWISILTWNTTLQQDPFFMEEVDGITYNRDHQCMKAEVIYEHDFNISNNSRQVNMNFVCVPGLVFAQFNFTLGWAGFSNYDPNIGKEMMLQLELDNINREEGWNLKLEGLEQIDEDAFRTTIRGTQPRSVELGITAPRPEVIGRTLKENLVIPPKAGGRHANVRRNSGQAPIYVKVNPASTLLVANYSFDEKDVQFVDLDLERKTPVNGPAGLPPSFGQEGLMYPNVPWGSLVGSFDNFKTAFLIAEGVQVQVPAGASYLAMGINDITGQYDDNSGPGFRVKVIERPQGSNNWGLLQKLKNNIIPEAFAQEKETLKIASIRDVMPTVCINGYEAIGQQRSISGTPHELYRYIGNVCWGIINVYPRDRSREPDRGDPYRPPCGAAQGATLGFSSLFSLVGVAFIWRRVSRKSRSKPKKRNG